jgi:hypothetical protein
VLSENVTIAVSRPVSPGWSRDVVPPIVIDSGVGEPGSATGVGETGLECLSQLASVKKATASGMIKTSRERRTVVAMTTSMALRSRTQFEYHGLFSNLG